MRARAIITALSLMPPLFSYAADAQPDGDLLEFLASIEIVDGEMLDPLEIDDMFNTKTLREKSVKESDDE